MAAVSGRSMILEIDNLSIDCETSSTITITKEALEVRCKTNGQWSTLVAGGVASGEISFEGIMQAPSSNSGFDLMQKTGAVYPFVFGGTAVGDRVVSGNFYLSTVEITAANDEIVTFSGSGAISGEPVFGVVTT